MSAFTQYWSNQTWYRESQNEGKPLRHTAAGTFLKRGVAKGDTLYVVSVIKEKMFLFARMSVDRICNQAQAEVALGEELWDGSDHILSNHGTPMRFQRQVPDSIVDQLRLGNDEPLKRLKTGGLDQQTLRPIRKLSANSAFLLDVLIGDTFATSRVEPEIIPQELYSEGTPKQISVKAYERNKHARDACIAQHGSRCHVCGVDFGERYGEIGKGFIHVHHLELLSAAGKNYKVDPRADLRPVCPNCHAMLHRQTPPLDLDVLKEMLQR